MSRTLRMLLAAGALGVLAVALPAAAQAASERCPTFQVVHDDPQAGFDAGTYTRINHAPTPRDLDRYLTCNDSYQVIRSYLYRPYTRGTGWKVRTLGGQREGKRFIKTRSNDQIYFDFYRRGGSGPTRTVSRTFDLSSDTVRRFTLNAPGNGELSSGSWRVSTPGGAFAGTDSADAASLFEDAGIGLWVPIRRGTQYQVLVNTPDFVQPGEYTVRLTGNIARN